jgi:hypothetical protein
LTCLYQRLRVSWYHSQVINDSQVTVCMAEPAVYEIFEHEAPWRRSYDLLPAFGDLLNAENR